MVDTLEVGCIFFTNSNVAPPPRPVKAEPSIAGKGLGKLAFGIVPVRFVALNVLGAGTLVKLAPSPVKDVAVTPFAKVTLLLVPSVMEVLLELGAISSTFIFDILFTPNNLNIYKAYSAFVVKIITPIV